MLDNYYALCFQSLCVWEGKQSCIFFFNNFLFFLFYEGYYKQKVGSLLSEGERREEKEKEGNRETTGQVPIFSIFSIFLLFFGFFSANHLLEESIDFFKKK